MKPIRQYDEIRRRIREPYRRFREFSCPAWKYEMRHPAHRQRFRLPLILAAMFLCALLSACGGGPDNREESATPESSKSENVHTTDIEPPVKDESDPAGGTVRSVDHEKDGSLLYHYIYPDDNAIWVDVRLAADGSREIQYYTGASAVISKDEIVTMWNLGGVRAVITPPEAPQDSKEAGLTLTFPDGVEVRKYRQGILKTAYPDGTVSTICLPNAAAEYSRVHVSATRFLFAGGEADAVVIPAKSNGASFTVRADGDFQPPTADDPKLYIGFMDGAWIQIQQSGHISTTFADGSQFRMQDIQHVNMEFRDGTQIKGTQVDADHYTTSVDLPELPNNPGGPDNFHYETAGGKYPDGTITSPLEVPMQFRITYPDGTTRLIRENNDRFEYQEEDGEWKNTSPKTSSPAREPEQVPVSGESDSASSSGGSGIGTKSQIHGCSLWLQIAVLLMILIVIAFVMKGLNQKKQRDKMTIQAKPVKEIQGKEKVTEDHEEAVKNQKQDEGKEKDEKETAPDQKPDEQEVIPLDQTENSSYGDHNLFFLEAVDPTKLAEKHYHDPNIRLKPSQNEWGHLLAVRDHQTGEIILAIPVLNSDESDKRIGIISNQDLYYSEVPSCFNIDGYVSSGKRFRVRVDQPAELEERGGYYQLVPGRTGRLIVEETLD